MIRIGVDLGGTKIEAVVLDVSAGAGIAGAGAGAERDDGNESESSLLPRELARARVPTNRELGYEHVVEATRALVARVASDAGVRVGAGSVGSGGSVGSIGVGMPGSMTFRRADGSTSDLALVKNSNTTCLNGQPFARDLMAAVGQPIAFANDANCFALAEAMWGASRDARVSFGVIIGTGVGGGLVIREGRNEEGAGGDRDADAPSRPPPYAWDGAQGIAGEWGHVVLVPAEDARPCYCGRRGCIETYLSGPAIEAAYARAVGSAGSVGAPRKKLLEIGQLARAGDRVASDLIAECMNLYGRALATVINIVDPDVIVLGGGVSNLPNLYEEGHEAVARWVFNDHLATKIVKNKLGDSAGVLGAALLRTRAR